MESVERIASRPDSRIPVAGNEGHGEKHSIERIGPGFKRIMVDANIGSLFSRSLAVFVSGDLVPIKDRD